MKEPYAEGLANHTGPESCGGGSDARVEALTGVRAGQVLSREILSSAWALSPEAGARCARSACRDLCEGCGETRIPTATLLLY